MKSKKVLALMMGAIVASSGMSQMVVQVYAHDEESSSSSYSDDYLGDINFLNEEESSGGAEPMEDSPAVEELEELTNFKSERIKNLPRYRYQMVNAPSNLYVSTSNLVFKPITNKEARLVYLDEENDFNENVVVPEKVSINGELYSVTSIGDNAFGDCRSLENVILPASITEIGSYAFVGCRSLENVILPASITEIGSYAFAFCGKLNLIKLPEKLHEIGDGAFSFCGELNLIELPENLREIGDMAFSCCKNLQLAALPEGLTTIGSMAFVGCKKLQLASLPQSLKIIGEEAFKNTGIRTITIPASVTELGDSAFDTNSIEEINLAQGSRLNNGDVERAYGRQLGRIIGTEEFRIRQRGITPVELNAEDAEEECPICYCNFNEVEGPVGRLLCGHRMHLDCFENLVRNNFERGVPFKCPICRRKYNIF